MFTLQVDHYTIGDDGSSVFPQDHVIVAIR